MAAPARKKAPMPKWKKSPLGLVELFGRVIPPEPDVERRRMFGYPCVFVEGNMFAGLFADRVFVRLSEKDRAGLLTKGAASPFEPLPGRVMKEYVVLEDAQGEESALAKVLARSLAFARTLPPKKSK
ncbi:MAG: TfoX/Sxy family protein [Candidatus Aminicenantes bacterium]|nr:TfoX/Sxy family protein [Candidatus Aminicenantes bacterium]